jgi:hypothetical protein
MLYLCLTDLPGNSKASKITSINGFGIKQTKAITGITMLGLRAPVDVISAKFHKKDSREYNDGTGQTLSHLIQTRGSVRPRELSI